MSEPLNLAERGVVLLACEAYCKQVFDSEDAGNLGEAMRKIAETSTFEEARAMARGDE